MKKRIEIEVDVPEGFEATGEWKAPVKGQWFLDTAAEPVHAIKANADYTCCRLILRKVEPKRETRWLNLYGPHNTATAILQKTRAISDKWATVERTGVARVEFEDDRVVGLHLEPIDIPIGEGLPAAEGR